MVQRVFFCISVSLRQSSLQNHEILKIFAINLPITSPIADS